MGTSETRIALNRFGLGARPGEVRAGLPDPSGWLLRQAAAPVPGVEASDARIRWMREFERAQREQDKAKADQEKAKPEAEKARMEGKAAATAPVAAPPAASPPAAPSVKPYDVYVADVKARVQHAIASDAPFAERLALFWSNHLAVSTVKYPLQVLVLPYENEAIRPHVFGSFADMLKASMRHPAMLHYLDNDQSFGPTSKAGAKNKKSYNENYARELMELHTLGVDGGYTPDDIIQLSLALTGWTVDREAGRALFRPEMHEPGDRVVLGQRYADEGPGLADRLLEALARHPKTAARLSRKLAAHFLGDTPPDRVVAAMTAAWTASGSRLPEVYKALLGAREAWTPARTKYKAPQEYVVSAARAVGLTEKPDLLLKALRTLAQLPHNAPAPTGYPDRESDWLTPDAVVDRINIAAAIAGAVPPSDDPLAVFEELTGPAPDSHSTPVIRNAPSRVEATALMLVSPEFQKR